MGRREKPYEVGEINTKKKKNGKKTSQLNSMGIESGAVFDQ